VTRESVAHKRRWFIQIIDPLLGSPKTLPAIAPTVEMDSSWNGSTASMCQAEHVWCFSESPYQKESDMNATIVAVDLAKNIFELAVADADWHIAQRQRLTRAKFLGFFVQLAPCQVVMEACGSAHYWARRERQRGHNKAAVALANRLARIVWATWKHERPFDGNWITEAT
jgi:hypothetical protein